MFKSGTCLAESDLSSLFLARCTMWNWISCYVTGHDYSVSCAGGLDLPSLPGVRTRSQGWVVCSKDHAHDTHIWTGRGFRVTRAGALTLNRAWDICDRLTASIPPVPRSPRSSPPVTSGVRAPHHVHRPRRPRRRSRGAIRAIASLIGSANVRKRSDARLDGRRRTRARRDRVTSHETYGNELFLATGSAAHVDAIAGGDCPVRFATEAELYASVGLPFIPPELRHDRGEIDAAARRSPAGAARGRDIRGDLHMHTVYSDGRDPVETMIAGCQRSATSTSRSPTIRRRDGVAHAPRRKSRDSATRLTRCATLPGLTILHGVEADICRTAASISRRHARVARHRARVAARARGHDRAAHQRSLPAIRHPLVNCSCHPANRWSALGRLRLDFDAVYAAAGKPEPPSKWTARRRTWTSMASTARAAMAAGVTLTVDSDCHRAKGCSGRCCSASEPRGGDGSGRGRAEQPATPGRAGVHRGEEAGRNGAPARCGRVITSVVPAPASPFTRPCHC